MLPALDWYYKVAKCRENVVGVLKDSRRIRPPLTPITSRSLLRPRKRFRQSLICAPLIQSQARFSQQ